MKITDIVLASSSPRRREIMEMLGIRFRVVESGADEKISGAVSPEDYVLQAAEQKNAAVRNRLTEEGSLAKDTLIVACDTMVVAGGVMLGKPPDESHAILTLGMLSDSWHSVLSGLSVYFRGRTAGVTARTDVKFRELSESEILAYVESGEPMGKAGSYAIQQKGASFVERIEGDFYNVVGFPVAALLALLRTEFGINTLDFINF